MFREKLGEATIPTKRQCIGSIMVWGFQKRLYKQIRRKPFELRDMYTTYFRFHLENKIKN